MRYLALLALLGALSLCGCAAYQNPDGTTNTEAVLGDAVTALGTARAAFEASEGGADAFSIGEMVISALGGTALLGGAGMALHKSGRNGAKAT